MTFDDVAIALPALSLAVERTAEALLAVLWPNAPGDPARAGRRKALAVLLTLVSALAIAIPLRLDLTDPLFGPSAFEAAQGVVVTALMLGAGAGPAHALIRRLETRRRPAGEQL